MPKSRFQTRDMAAKGQVNVAVLKRRFIQVAGPKRLRSRPDKDRSRENPIVPSATRRFPRRFVVAGTYVAW